MATFPTMYPDRHLTARVHGRAVSLLRHRERGSAGAVLKGVRMAHHSMRTSTMVKTIT